MDPDSSNLRPPPQSVEENHEASVLAGMRKLIERDPPALIVETGLPEVVADLASRGYVSEKLPGSPNFLFRTMG